MIALYFFFARLAALIGFCQLCLFVVVLLKRPDWIRSIASLFLFLADVVDGPSVQHYRVNQVPRRGATDRQGIASPTATGDDPARITRHRGTRKGGLIRCDKQLVDPGTEVLNELTSALVNLGASKQDAREAAQLAMRSGVQDFDTLLRAALQEAAHVS